MTAADTQWFFRKKRGEKKKFADFDSALAILTGSTSVLVRTPFMHLVRTAPADAVSGQVFIVSLY